MALLLQSGALSRDQTSAAIRGAFERRRTNDAPTLLTAPGPAWERPFATLVRECGLEIDLAAAFLLVERFYDSVRSRH